MNNFIMGIFAGFAIFGAIIILVDQLRGRGWKFNFNLIDILGGLVVWIGEKMTESATKFAERRVRAKFADEDAYYGKHEMGNAERLDIEDVIFEVVEDLANEIDPDMEYIDRVVGYCEGKVV